MQAVAAAVVVGGKTVGTTGASGTGGAAAVGVVTGTTTTISPTTAAPHQQQQPLPLSPTLIAPQQAMNEQLPGSPTSPSKRELRLKEKVYAQLKGSQRDESAGGKWLQAVVAEGAKPWVLNQLQLKGGFGGGGGTSRSGGSGSGGGGGSSSQGGGPHQQHLPGVKVAVVGLDQHPGDLCCCACVVSAPSADNKDLGQVEIFVNTSHEALAAAMVTRGGGSNTAELVVKKEGSSSEGVQTQISSLGGPTTSSSTTCAAGSGTATDAECQQHPLQPNGVNPMVSSTSASKNSTSTAASTSASSSTANASVGTNTTANNINQQQVVSRRALKRVKQQQEDEQKVLYSPEELLPAVTLFFGNFLALEIANALGSTELAPNLNKALLKSMYKHSGALLANGTCALAGTGIFTNGSSASAGGSQTFAVGGGGASSTTTSTTTPAPSKPPSPLRIPTTLPPPVPPPAPEIPFPGTSPNIPLKNTCIKGAKTNSKGSEKEQDEPLTEKLSSNVSNQWNQVGRGGKKTKKTKSKDSNLGKLSPPPAAANPKSANVDQVEITSNKWTELLKTSLEGVREGEVGIADPDDESDEEVEYVEEDMIGVGEIKGTLEGVSLKTTSTTVSSVAATSSSAKLKVKVSSDTSSTSTATANGKKEKTASKTKAAHLFPVKNHHGKADHAEEVTHSFAEATRNFVRGLLRLTGMTKYEESIEDDQGMQRIARAGIEAVQRQVAIELQLREGVESKKVLQKLVWSSFF